VILSVGADGYITATTRRKSRAPVFNALIFSPDTPTALGITGEYEANVQLCHIKDVEQFAEVECKNMQSSWMKNVLRPWTKELEGSRLHSRRALTVIRESKAN